MNGSKLKLQVLSRVVLEGVGGKFTGYKRKIILKKRMLPEENDWFMVRSR